MTDHGRQLAARASSDHSLAGLVAANAVALALAWRSGMTLRELMLVYWIQSVVIGVMHVIRILKLQRFSTEDFTLANRGLEEAPDTKSTVAFVFAVHYGMAHLIYFVFLSMVRGGIGPTYTYFLCALAFTVNHAFSLRHNLESDAAGRPNIGKLMLLPYARIAPMHLMVLAGVVLEGGASTAGFFVFGILKTVADGVMHTVEHHLMAQGAAADEQ